MAIHIKNILVGKKGQRDGPSSNIGIVKNTLAPGNTRSVAIIPAYDIVEEVKDSEANVHIARTVETPLLRRAQMLQ